MRQETRLWLNTHPALPAKPERAAYPATGGHALVSLSGLL